jgi:hypothetical protein
LKSRKERLIRENHYTGRGREAIAVRFGDLLSYPKDVIRSKSRGRSR